MNLVLARFASMSDQYDAFLNKDGKVCVMEHDFGSPSILNVSPEEAAAWLAEQTGDNEAQILEILKKLQPRTA